MFSITLTNFRSFKNQKFNFDNFNILIGENSSGKSSLFKFLLAIKQSFQAPANREINLLFSGEYVDLGNYKESIYYHDDSLPMSFKFGFGSTYYKYFLDFMLGDASHKSFAAKKLIQNVNAEGSETEISFELTKHLNIHTSIKTHIKNNKVGELIIEYLVEEVKTAKTPLSEQKCNLKFLDFSTQTVYHLKNIGYSKDAFMTLIEPDDLKTSCRRAFSIPDRDFKASEITKDQQYLLSRVDKLWDQIAFLLVAQNYLRSTFERLEYINPINTHLSRFYFNKDQKIFSTINNLDDVLAFFNSSAPLKDKIFKDFVKILKKVGIADQIEIIDDERLPVRELRVKVKDLVSNISDVGYGVSLQMPIILKALLAEKLSLGRKRFILIEQPEVHLHPKLHASLIDALMSLSKNTTYFIETHSEHIVRKLQVMVKNKVHGVSPDNVTIHYLVRKGKQSQVSSHKIKENGLLEESFPTGFFDNSFILSKQLL